MTSSKNSVVIDSNVWISALVFGGNPRRVFELAVQNGISIVMSAEIETEVRRNLHTKFPGFADDFEELLHILRGHLRYVKLGSIEVTASRDSDDNRVLETAVLSHTKLIVSGDKDLLSLKMYAGIHILTPVEFLTDTA